MHTNMKKLTVLLILPLFTITLLTANGKKLPNVEIKDINGQKIDIASIGDSGKVVVLNFWATWCTPCKKELNNISDVYETWKEDYNVEVYAISIDDSRNAAKVKSYINGQGWEFPVLLDENQDLQRALNFQTVPYAIMLDKNGEIVYEHNGYVEGDEYELEDTIKEYSEK